MKTYATALMGLFVTLSALASAQTSVDIDQLGRDFPIEIQIVENRWYDYYPDLYSIWGLVPTFSEHVLSANSGAVIAEPTVKLLAENRDRLDLEAAEFVNTNSSIFDRRSMRPAEWYLRVTLTGAATSNTRGIGVRVGGTGIGLDTEGGTSTAIARFELIRRRDMVTVATETVKKVYSSTNITGLSADRFGFFTRGQSLAFEQSSDGGYRRGIVSTCEVLKASKEAIRKLLTRLR